MQGNGQFVIRPANGATPMRLQLNQLRSGAVEVVASMEDGTTQSLCMFQKGEIVLSALCSEVSKRLGINQNGFGYIGVSSGWNDDLQG